MSPIVIAAIVLVVVLAVGAYFFLGRKPEEPKLPPPGAQTKPEEAKPEPAKPKRKEEPKEAPKKAEPKPAKAEEQPAARAEAPKAKAEAPAPAEDDGPEISAEEPAPEPAVVTRAAVAVAVKGTAPSAPSDAEARERVAILKKGLATTRGGFIARLAQIFGRKKEIDPGLLDEMQAVLITADIGPRTADKLLERLRERFSQLRDTDAVWGALAEEGRRLLEGTRAGGIQLGANGSPTTILVVGVNGVGKTTTIGKLASHFKQDGKKVVLAAGDTFRAAAVLQLEVWAKRVGCDLVKGKDRADPSSVVFDAVKKAKAEGLDVVIADTAGRLHTKSNLMEELKKVVRTAEKALERPVDEVLLVLDATTGQNAIQQAQLFKEAIPVSGIVLTKLDGTAKGGVVLGIVDEHRVPVRYIGIGERVEDLREFDAESFVRALFEKPEEEPAPEA